MDTTIYPGPEEGTTQSDSPVFDRTETLRALTVFFGAGPLSRLVELRALDVLGANGERHRTVSGIFDNIDALLDEAAATSGISKGVYFGMNPPDAAQVTVTNLVMVAGKGDAVSDRQIGRRTLLLIDIDPVRPKDTSSTKAEFDLALVKATAIRTALSSEGFPDPVVAQSGNGAHLYYRVDLPAQDGGVVKRFLHRVAERFDDEFTRIDRTVHNPARIARLPGTLAMKGHPTDERPHRLAHIVSNLDSPPLVATELLERFAPPPVPKSRSSKSKQTPGRVSGAAIDLAQWLNEHGIVHSDAKDWSAPDGQEGMLYTLEMCPFSDQHADGAFAIQFENGGAIVKCHHESCKGKGLRDLDPNAANGGVPYGADGDGIFKFDVDADGNVTKVRLANFSAQVTHEVERDDGIDAERRFRIESVVSGRAVKFDVAASDFASLDWVLPKLGVRAIVEPGRGVKDQLRAAIQWLSGGVHSHTVYACTGWTDDDLYLHAGGAIGATGTVTGIEVDLPEPLRRYRLPDPPSGPSLRRAVHASLSTLDVAANDLMIPLLGAAYMAPLGQPDFAIHLTGPTGVAKSELCALMSQHFGSELDARHFPGNWGSTSNALQELAFATRNALFVVDDYAPAGNQNDVQRMQKTIETFVRAIGNQAPRQRMRADTSLRSEHPPRALVLSSGEDVGGTVSVRARMVILEVTKGSVDWSVLSRAQADGKAGLFGEAMAGFIHWIARDRRHAEDRLQRLVRVYQSRFMRTGHKRHASSGAQLLAGWATFLLFAHETGTIDRLRRRALLASGVTVMETILSAQEAHLDVADPVDAFLRCIDSAVTSGGAHLASPDGGAPVLPGEMALRPTDQIGPLTAGWRLEAGSWRPRGELIGWTDGEELYLDPNASFGVAKRVAERSGQPIAISWRTMGARLADRGLLRAADRARNRFTTRTQLAGARRAVWHIGLNAVILVDERPVHPSHVRQPASGVPTDHPGTGAGQMVEPRPSPSFRRS